MAEFKEGVTNEMIECAKGYADYIQEQIKSSDAVVLLEQKVDFSMWVPHGFGTCDCIIMQDKEAVIIDYKYGVGVPVSAEDNPQMKLYALGVINDFGIAYDFDTIHMHIYQPRINNVSSATISVKELLHWGTEVVGPRAELAIKGRGLYRSGEHCRFCPHAGQCRELSNYCTKYVETRGMRVGVPVLADWEVADILMMEPMISLWLKRVKGQAMTTLMNGGTVPGYKVVEGQVGNRKWKDEFLVMNALSEAGYKSEDITETKLLSPAAMDKVIGKRNAEAILGEYIDRSPGAPTVVPESDKRPAYDRVAEAVKDFE